MLPMNATETNAAVNRGFKIAKDITKKFAKTFYFSSTFLPKDKQNAAYAIYAICRISDESVDSINNPLDCDKINLIKDKIQCAYGDSVMDDELLNAFRETVNKYEIPKQYFEDLIEGMHMDINIKRYNNFEELYKYCYRVAGVVGLIMLKVFEYKNSEAEKFAIDLGIAMQLTNILRDIKEDFSRGRIYIPNEEMKRFNVSEKQISDMQINQNFIDLLKFQIERARSYYQESIRGIKMIHNKRSRLAICAMKEIYSAILNSIEINKYDVFYYRAHVNLAAKLIIVSKILARGNCL
jgi:phytoene synthase